MTFFCCDSGASEEVIAAVKRARYAPRFEDGEPVDTIGVTLRERIVMKRSKDGD
jgi:hypothetical protein